MASSWGFTYEEEDSFLNQNIFQDDTNFFEFFGFGGYSSEKLKGERPTAAEHFFKEEPMDTVMEEYQTSLPLQEKKVAQFVFNITKQPPSEVRTRTPGEKRSFKTKVQVSHFNPGMEVGVELYYAPDRSHYKYELVAKQTVLGGSKRMAVSEEGLATFDLCMWEASRKHEEREFALKFFVVGKEKEQRFSILSDSFYAYSHQRVLAKRKEVVVRTLNQSWGFGGVISLSLTSFFLYSFNLFITFSRFVHHFLSRLKMKVILTKKPNRSKCTSWERDSSTLQA